MSEEETSTINVTILDKEYQVKCLVSEVDALRRSATYLDQKMREMRDKASVIGLERIAVMASLNIANDLLKQVSKTKKLVTGNDQQVTSLSMKLDQAINRIRPIATSDPEDTPV
jgi:cell division protein ZapA|tara:strand:- start:3204 stop:3545 length:342 start_codon:yes stop_codon:yes gene_type:complete